jgi:putative phosphoesterase
MKKILLLSDTHGYIGDDILKYVKEADEVWHAGDIGALSVTDEIKKHRPLKAVYGNIDDTKIRSEFPEHHRFQCEDIRVWITHIGGYPNRYDRRIRESIKMDPPDLFISGHSHILKVMPDKKLDLLHMNPGAAGKRGLHKIRTMLRFVIDKDQVKELEVIEFGRG